MELGKPGRAHVGNVHVADPAVGALVNDGTVFLDPLAISARHLAL